MASRSARPGSTLPTSGRRALWLCGPMGISTQCRPVCETSRWMRPCSRHSSCATGAGIPASMSAGPFSIHGHHSRSGHRIDLVLFVANNATVEEFDVTVHALGETEIVRHRNHGLALLVDNIAQNREDLFAGLGIERPGRLIRKND